jgi:hypothetical protein
MVCVRLGKAWLPTAGPSRLLKREATCTLKGGRRAAGAAIFFEFKHYKVEKHKWSTKCWAFLEREVRVLCPRPAFRLPRARVLPIYAATPPFLLTPYSRSPPLPALLSAWGWA